jgi:hypothetical protein
MLVRISARRLKKRSVKTKIAGMNTGVLVVTYSLQFQETFYFKGNTEPAVNTKIAKKAKMQTDRIFAFFRILRVQIPNSFTAEVAEDAGRTILSFLLPALSVLGGNTDTFQQGYPRCLVSDAQRTRTGVTRSTCDSDGWNSHSAPS